jgi:hypothetical protein
VPVRSVHGFAACTPNTKTLNHPPTSTHNNSVNMAPIDDALAAIEARELGEEIVYQHYADKYSVARSTLSRRHRRVCRSREDYAADKQLLAPAQEAELVEYINSLTKQGLPPTREMIQNFSSTIAPWELGESWVTRFLHRHQHQLLARWTTGLDRPRHQADSLIKYESYFDLLHNKMKEHGVEPRFTYNMDEKGFMIGVEGRSKRVFSKQVWVKGGCRAPVQDGNREWITVLPTICADGTALPTGIIFQAENGNIRDTWVNDLTVNEEQLFVTSSPSGWSSNEIGLAWLTDVFDRHTKEKCRRSYRLLIMDGHGSHITKPFIDYCHQNRILLAIYPPHSTHTLQPLDVVLFKPLSTAYSSELRRQTYRSQGLMPVVKSDFIPLFRAAYASAFTKTNIITGFKATGIWPMDPFVITNKFNYTTPSPNSDSRVSSNLSPNDWKRVERLLQQTVKDSSNDVVRRLEASIHRASTETKLLRHENEGLRASLATKNKRKRHGKRLPLTSDESVGGGAIFWSPQKVDEARGKQAEIEEDERQEKLKKVEMKELRAASKLYKEKIIEEKRAERERAKVVREKERAEKAAEKQRQKEERNLQKAIQTSQTGKRKASRASAPKNKRQKRSGGSAAARIAPTRSPSPPPRITSRGRSIKVPSKFR